MPVGAIHAEELVFAEGASFVRTWAYAEGPHGSEVAPAGWSTPGRWSARMQVRRRIGDTTALLTASTADGTIVLGTSGTDATVTLNLPADYLNGATWRDGWWDLKVRDTGVAPNFVVRLVQGRAWLDRAVTSG